MKQQLETLETAHGYMERLYEGVQCVIDAFDSQQENKAYDLLVQVIDGLLWLVDVFELTKEVEGQFISAQEIKPILAELIEAQENDDSVLIRDLLQYEIMTSIEKWYQIVSNIIEVNKGDE